MKKKGPGILELKAKRLAASAAKKHAEADLANIDAQLLLLVPAGEEQEGVVHVHGEAGTPAWKQIFEEAKKLIPATKQGVLLDIISAHTGSKRDYIRLRAEQE